MIIKVRTGAVMGIEGLAVTVEVDISQGLPGFHLVGLPNTAVKESRERVLAALRHSGFRFPAGKVTINLAPAGVKKEGASYDLAIALAIVAALGRIDQEAMSARCDMIVLGELSLFGEVRPVRGLLAIVLDAVARGDRSILVPASQAWEAQLATDIEVIPIRTLAEAVYWWQKGRLPADADIGGGGESGSAGSVAGVAARPDEELIAENARRDLATLAGQDLARRAAIVAAAGRHHILLVGPPGAGKTRLARIIAAVQPPLSAAEGLEVTRIHSATGLLLPGGIVQRRPLRAPHHTVTRAGLVGGGSNLRPGEVTLAHRGVLFLDEIAEFSTQVIDALREPLEDGRITVSRGSGCRAFPAAFQFIAAMNPCRCGYLGSTRRSCRCPPAALRRYRGRLSGPLLDRFDLFVEMNDCASPLESVTPSSPADGATGDWRQIGGRVPIESAWRRLQGAAGQDSATGGDLMGQLSALGLDRAAIAFLDHARRGLAMSVRGLLRCARVARTLAALDAQAAVADSHVAEALEFRQETLASFQTSADEAVSG